MWCSLRIAIRLTIVLSFLLAMPVLALPPVASWCEEHLYPPAPRRFVRTTPSAQESAVVAIVPTPLLDYPWIEPSHASLVPETADELERLATEVRQLGASFYRLDLVQQDPPLYRFTAQWTDDGEIPRRSQFAAVDASPAESIRRVIHEITSSKTDLPDARLPR